MYEKHRKRLLSLFEKEKESVIFLKGGSVSHRYHTDYEYPFRQESHFLYLTGVGQPDMAALLHCGTGEYCLVIPRRDTQYAVWMGYVLSPDEYMSLYRPDRVIYEDEVTEWLNNIRPKTIHCLPGSEKYVQKYVQKYGYKPKTEDLQDALSWCRVIKSGGEIECLKKAAAVGNRAHLKLMQSVAAGLYEYEMKAIFEFHATRSGLLHAPYSGIFASGPNSAILHYTDNRRMLENGELLLVDAGTEYRGYASDITRTFPVNGRFSPLQADLYDIVLEAQTIALNRIKPGNKMEDLHLASSRTILAGLRECKLVYGDIDELMEKNVFALFFPHGLGHFLGLDTHDTGGYPKGTEKIDRPGLQFLRTRRTLETGMVLTVEPGLYFITALLEPAFRDKKISGHLNTDRLKELLNFGGIRIEDNVIVRDDGIENMTTVPKLRHEIEHLILSGLNVSEMNVNYR